MGAHKVGLELSGASRQGAPRSLSAVKRCGLCECRMAPEDPRNDFIKMICGDCKDHPEAESMGQTSKPSGAGGLSPAFTAADKGLIGKLHRHLPAAQLLSILNERLEADRGTSTTPHTIEQLHSHLRELPDATAGANDWAGLRKTLAKARSEGTLSKINRSTLNDFAVVFSLSPAQVVRMKDVILDAGDSEDSETTPQRKEKKHG